MSLGIPLICKRFYCIYVPHGIIRNAPIFLSSINKKTQNHRSQVNIHLVNILAKETHRQGCLTLVSVLSCFGWLEIPSQSHLSLEKGAVDLSCYRVCCRVVVSYSRIRNPEYSLLFQLPSTRCKPMFMEGGIN